MIIDVRHLSKSFDYYKKELGLKNSIKNLFYREKLTKAGGAATSRFEIEEGEMVGFLGPNGAGKTTTLKMLSGILHPTGGQGLGAGLHPLGAQEGLQDAVRHRDGPEEPAVVGPARQRVAVPQQVHLRDRRPRLPGHPGRADRAAGRERPAERAGAAAVAGRAHEDGADRRPDPQAQADLPGRADHRPGHPLAEEDSASSSSITTRRRRPRSS